MPSDRVAEVMNSLGEPPIEEEEQAPAASLSRVEQVMAPAPAATPPVASLQANPIGRVAEVMANQQRAVTTEGPTLMSRIALFGSGVAKAFVDMPDEQIERAGEFLEQPQGDQESGFFGPLDRIARTAVPQFGALANAISTVNATFNGAAAEVGKEIREAASQRLTEREEEFVQDIHDPVDQMIAMGGESFGRMLPAFLAGGVGGTPAALATINYLAMSAGESQALREGHSAGAARAYGALSGIIEAGTEALPVATLLKRTPFKQKLIKFLVQEVGTEWAAAYLDKINAQATLDKDWTAAELYRDLALVTGSTILTGGAQVATVNTAMRAAQTVKTFQTLNAKTQRELAQGKASREYAKLQQETLELLEQEGYDIQDKTLVFHSSPTEDIETFSEDSFDMDWYDRPEADAAGVYFSDSREYSGQYKGVEFEARGANELLLESSQVEAILSTAGEMMRKDRADPTQLSQYIAKAADAVKQNLENDPNLMFKKLTLEGHEAAREHLLSLGENLTVDLYKGRVYEVLLDKDAPYLDWKLPLTEQSPKTRKILEDNKVPITPSMTGKQLYRYLQERRFNNERGSSLKVSKLMNSWGILGMRDARRSPQDKSRHYVYSIFDSGSPAILELNGQKTDVQALLHKLENWSEARKEILDNPSPLRMRRKLRNFKDAAIMSKDDMYAAMQDELAFDLVRRLTMGLEQLADDPANQNFAPLQEYRSLVHDRHAEWGKWAQIASDKVDTWDDMLSFNPQLEMEMNKLIGQVAKISEAQERRLTPEEVLQVSKDLGLKKVEEKHLRFLETVWDDYARAFEASRQSIFDRIDDATTSDAARAELKAAVSEHIDPLVNQNYAPKMRFGKWTNIVRDKERHVVARRNYRTKGDRDGDVANLRKEYPGAKIERTVDKRAIANRERMAFAGVPDSFIEKLDESIGLTPEQREQAQALQFEQEMPMRFARSLAKDDATPGWSDDYLRSYATFFSAFANRKASMDFDHHLQRRIEAAESVGSVEGEKTKQAELAAWMARHRDYLRNPGNEWQDARALGFTFYLGFVPKSALINLTQVPLVSLPVMSKEYGYASTVKALTKATNQFFTNLRLGNQYTFEQQQAIAEGRRTVLEENQGSMLGAVTAENNLQRFSGGRFGNNRTLNRALRSGIEAAAVLFQAAENFNRQITLTAVYDLERQKGTDHSAAVQKGIRAVRQTHLEYARFNRPELMRGKKSILFLFMNYLSQMSWLYANDPAKWRVIGMMLAAGGLSGLPFADNILDTLSGMWTEIGKHAGIKDPKAQFHRDLHDLFEGIMEDPEIPMTQTLRKLGLQPDTFAELMMHGTSRYLPNPLTIGTGHYSTVDASASLSLGRILPGTELLAREYDSDRAISEGVRQAGGAVLNIPFNLLEVALSDNPDMIRALEKVSPTEPKHLTRMLKWMLTGQETDAQGDVVARFDKLRTDSGLVDLIRGVAANPEAIAQGLGFAPTELNIKRDRQFDAYDRQRFYLGWRTGLLDRNWRAVKDQNPRKVQAVRKAIHEYNRQVPYPILRITADNLKESMLSRAKRSRYKEAGTTSERKVRGLYHEVLDRYSQPLDYTDEPQQ